MMMLSISGPCGQPEGARPAWVAGHSAAFKAAAWSVTRNISDKGSLPVTVAQAGPNYVQAVTFGGAPGPGPLAALWHGLHLNLPSRRARAAAAATMARWRVTASESSITNILKALTRT